MPAVARRPRREIRRTRDARGTASEAARTFGTHRYERDIGIFGPFEFGTVLPIVLYRVLPTVLFWRILGRAGFPSLFALLALVPGYGYIALLLLLAVADWPRQRASS